jgi:exosortase H (IPTLxxWG-CTERM-specific)
VFGALAVLSELLYGGVLLQSQVFQQYLAFLAHVSAVLLQGFGRDVTVVGAELSTAGFSVEIADGCDAIQLCSLLAAAIFAFPVRVGLRLRGIFLGLLWLQSLNFARIITLFLIGPVSPEIFSILHRIVWPTALIVLTVATWVVWALWGYRATAAPESKS